MLPKPTLCVVDIYDVPETTEATGDDQAADDRIAEQFRRDFMDQVASKNVRKAPPPPPGPGGKDAPKGPKLGGSRSARAAMRLQEEKAAKKR
jgi:hypothetical protein